jgi:hypothetical protein
LSLLKVQQSMLLLFSGHVDIGVDAYDDPSAVTSLESSLMNLEPGTICQSSMLKQCQSHNSIHMIFTHLSREKKLSKPTSKSPKLSSTKTLMLDNSSELNTVTND